MIFLETLRPHGWKGNRLAIFPTLGITVVETTVSDRNKNSYPGRPIDTKIVTVKDGRHNNGGWEVVGTFDNICQQLKEHEE